jgi:hypothetical protein
VQALKEVLHVYYHIQGHKNGQGRAEGMAQSVECLPPKYKAPSSNPRTIKKKEARF